MTDKLYADRNIMSLDMKGNYYCKHVVALTRENLVGKSEIAAELAYRDYTIDQLQRKLDEANQYISNQALRVALVGEVSPEFVEGLPNTKLDMDKLKLLQESDSETLINGFVNYKL